jgi:hypothetical protein
MSWSELERLVEAAEVDPTIRHCLRQCDSKANLILVARHLGFRITRVDLQRAWTDHQRRRHAMPGRADRAAWELP